MKVAKLMAALMLLVAGTSFAADDGWYGKASFDQKDKLNSSTNEFHNVTALTIGKRLGDGWSIEALVEEELVKNGSSGQGDEGLYQLRLNKSFATGTMFTPYVGLSVGEKNKATIGFPIYRYDIGVNTALGERLVLGINWRHRQAFDDKLSSGAATKYDTNETRIGLGYKLTKVDTITVSYAQERRADKVSSEYNTTAISYSRSF